jgi:hypothetical protein
VNSIVLEVPDGALGAMTIGFWGVRALATDAGGWRQINRAGQPIFNPDDGERSSAYNTTQPSEDRPIYGPLVSTLVAGDVAAMEASADPQAYGESVDNLALDERRAGRTWCDGLHCAPTLVDEDTVQAS